MEKKINISILDNLESVVYTLLAARARGEHVYCIFRGYELHSDTVTMDSAFLQVVGCTKAQYDKEMEEERINFQREKKEREIRELGYVKKVLESRFNDPNATITVEKVVNGLKYIAENKTIPHDELVDGLLELGCNFTLKDIKEQLPTIIKYTLDDGLRFGNLATGATFIVNARDTEFGRHFCITQFLGVDNETSIYHFIRVVSGDDSYTKEYVDSLVTNPKKLVK